MNNNNDTTHTGKHARKILQDTDIVTRFPPSPTGDFHIGSARTALFNWLFATANDGEMVMRFEDTDQSRSKERYEDDILDGLEWLDINYFGPLFRQSERTDVYTEYLQTLIDNGSAYISDEADGDEDEVIRFDNPHKTITFDDKIRGEIEFDTSDLGDFVIAKDMESPLYHLAVVVDDYEMGVSHVIRGDDHISNTPRQILIYEALDIPRPAYAHIPLILGPDKSKLSKRHGATSINEFKEAGYLSGAVINYLALLGWNPGNDRELFSREELVEAFSLKRVQKSAAVFDIEKLTWFNREYLRHLDDDTLMHDVRNRIPADIKKLPGYSLDMLEDMLPIFRERIDTFKDVEHMANNGDLEFYFETPGYYPEGLLWRDISPDTNGFEKTKDHLQTVIAKLEDIQADEFTNDRVKDAIWEFASETGRGEVLWPMRYALSGKDESPGPFQLASVLGKDETLQRLHVAIEKIDDAINKS